MREFIYWLEETNGEDLQRMSDDEKGRCLYIFLSDPSLKEIVLQGMNDYMIGDGHWAASMIVSDEQCGKDIKDCTYSCFESEIIDAMTAYSRYKIGLPWLSNVLSVLI